MIIVLLQWTGILSLSGQKNNREENDFFGYSVAVDKNIAVAGAPQEDEDEEGLHTMDNAGAAYIYVKNDEGKWIQQQKIVASDRATNDNFGAVVSISGHYVVVGAYLNDQIMGESDTISNVGAVYIFEKNESGIWEEIQKLVPADGAADDFFGYSVSISNDQIIVGAYQSDKNVSGASPLSDAGAAYIFKKNVTDYWEQTQKLTASDRAANDHFGFSVSISGDYALVGAPLEDHDISGGDFRNSAGSAYLFKKTGNNWIQQQKIIASDRTASDEFGISVAIDGNNCIVGAYCEEESEEINKNAGAAYVFEENASGLWMQKQKLVAADRSLYDFFGRSVAISGNYIVVGAYCEDEDENALNFISSSGSAYIFHKENGQWIQHQKIVASHRYPQDLFGYSVAIDGNICIVGAYQEDEDANEENFVESAGSAYVFENAVIETSTAHQDILPLDFYISPNPIRTNKIQIYFNHKLLSTYNVTVTDMTGKTILRKILDIHGEAAEISLNNSIEDGIYTLSLDNIGTLKFIINKQYSK